MGNQFKYISVVLSLLCVLATACGNDRSSMINEIESTQKILKSIEPSSVSSDIYKMELFAEKALLQTEANALLLRVDGIDKIEHGKFAQEQQAVQGQIDALRLRTIKMKTKIARIHLIDNTQNQLDELQLRIAEVKEKAKAATGDLKVKYENTVTDLELHLSEINSRVVELTTHLKDSSDELWESLKAKSETAWNLTKAKIKSALDALSGEL